MDQQSWGKWRFLLYAAYLAFTIYRLVHNWGDWLYLTAYALIWLLIGYREFRWLSRRDAPLT
jgi:hypothetical protein